MQSSKFVFDPVVVLLAALAAPALAQSVHDGHAAHAPSAHAEAPAPAQRWATDAPLRDGMRQIRQAVQAFDHYEHGHMDATQAHNTAQHIDEAVKGMIAACKLQPEADAALHGLLAKFLAGAQAVRTSEVAPSAAIADMRAALARYPQLFDDAEWNSPAD